MSDSTPPAEAEAEIESGADDGLDQVAGAPSDNTTLVDVLAELKADGYEADLRAIGDLGEVRCGACGQASSADTLTDLVERRLEGASDPDDMVLAIGARCPACGERGVMTLGYGPAASEADAAAVALLP
ncbi:hypothetical protein BH10ACT1_BH10ACT1_13620 [soil metagenome]